MPSMELHARPRSCHPAPSLFAGPSTNPPNRRLESERRPMAALPLEKFLSQQAQKPLPQDKSGLVKWRTIFLRRAWPATIGAGNMSATLKASIAPVPTANDFLDIVLSKTQRKTPTVIHPGFKITRIRTFYMRKVMFTKDAFTEKLQAILSEFPILEVRIHTSLHSESSPFHIISYEVGTYTSD